MSRPDPPPAGPAPLATADRRPSPRTLVRAAVTLALVTSLTACGGGGDASGLGPTSTVVASESTAASAVDESPPTPVVIPPIGTRRGTLDSLGTAIAEPVGLRLPSIGVDAVVRPVGVEPDGEMEVPAATDVGWYRFGPAPGATGSAVLAAHVDYDGRRGAFFELRSISPGDPVEVTMADGSVQEFRIDDVVQVPKGDLSASGVFDRTGPARLALITCGGSFDAEARSYRDNVVAYAVPVAGGLDS